MIVSSSTTSSGPDSVWIVVVAAPVGYKHGIMLGDYLESFRSISLALLGTGIVASLLPALRAARVDPMIALKNR